jgi:hypothetical protein
MSIDGHWTDHRTPFPVRSDDRDYSGLNIENAFLADSTALSHSFMNGTNVSNSIFVRAALDQIEFAEALMEKSVFLKCDLEGSDFIRSIVQDCSFEQTSVVNGEWRETEYRNTNFTDCDFTHTTINLCRFQNCRFLGSSSSTMNHRSINYNTFDNCEFSGGISSEYVLSQNFGIPSDLVQSPSLAHKPMTLSEVCRISSRPSFRVSDLIDAIEAECQAQSRRSNKLLIEFIANIVASLAAQRRISAPALIYVENLFATLGRSASSTANFASAMGAIVRVRNAMFDLVTNNQVPRLNGEVCTALIFWYEDIFNEELAEDLAPVLGQLLLEDSTAVELVAFSNGSTLMEYAFSMVAPATAVASTLGLILTQANITVKGLNEFKTGAKALAPRLFSRKEATKPQAVGEPGGVPAVAPAALPERVPAIMNTDAVLPQLVPIRIAVEKSGKTLILLDNRVEITISV